MPNINGVAEDIVLKSDLLNFIYPVGSYYWSAQPILPDELFGGKWEQIQGKVVVAAGTYTDKNGEERSFEVGETDSGEYNHTLRVNEMPSHSHPIPVATMTTGSTAASNYIRFNNNDTNFIGRIDSHATGGGAAHNNMPPYEVAYCWKRIT